MTHQKGVGAGAIPPARPCGSPGDSPVRARATPSLTPSGLPPVVATIQALKRAAGWPPEPLKQTRLAARPDRGPTRHEPRDGQEFHPPCCTPNGHRNQGQRHHRQRTSLELLTHNRPNRIKSLTDGPRRGVDDRASAQEPSTLNRRDVLAPGGATRSGKGTPYSSPASRISR